MTHNGYIILIKSAEEELLEIRSNYLMKIIYVKPIANNKSEETNR